MKTAYGVCGVGKYEQTIKQTKPKFVVGYLALNEMSKELAIVNKMDYELPRTKIAIYTVLMTYDINRNTNRRLA